MKILEKEAVSKLGFHAKFAKIIKKGAK